MQVLRATPHDRCARRVAPWILAPEREDDTVEFWGRSAGMRWRRLTQPACRGFISHDGKTKDLTA
jgi:hypothetical protein